MKGRGTASARRYSAAYLRRRSQELATPETRATYTAVSNTAIGALLLFGGLFGVMAEMYGPRAVLIALAAMAALAVPAALRLEEVQRADEGTEAEA